MLKFTAGTLAFLMLASAAVAQTKPSPTPAQRKTRPTQQATASPDDASLLREADGSAPLSKSATFSFRRGELAVDIRCAESEPIKPCADAALTLMDKFGNVASSMPQPPMPPAPSASPAATTP